jgi:hypothetical protein
LTDRELDVRVLCRTQARLCRSSGTIWSRSMKAARTSTLQFAKR